MSERYYQEEPTVFATSDSFPVSEQERASERQGLPGSEKLQREMRDVRLIWPPPVKSGRRGLPDLTGGGQIRQTAFA